MVETQALEEATRLTPQRETAAPGVLTDDLRPGEALVWWGRGHGPALDPFYGWATAGACTVLLVSDLVERIFGVVSFPPEVPIFVTACLATLLAIRYFVGARFELYGLTDQRVVRVNSFALLLRRYSAGTVNCLAGPIMVFRVFGTTRRGTVRLQPFGNSKSGHRPFRLLQVDHPLKVAALIKSTLKLALPIEDHAR